jgi:hypothetical protein
MLWTLHRFLSTLPFILVASASTSSNPDTLTITSLAPYHSLRQCAQHCVCNSVSPAYQDLVLGLGCATPFYNDCYCRTDLSSAASSFLSSCISISCTFGGPAGDITSAESVYNGYCNAIRDASGAMTTPAVDTTAPTVTRVTVVTQTLSSGSSVITLTHGELLSLRGLWVLSIMVTLGMGWLVRVRVLWHQILRVSHYD